MSRKSRKSEGKFIDAGGAESEQYQPDDEVVEEFSEAQRLVPQGKLYERDEHPGKADLSAGDVDADWAREDVGDETVGGSSPTPDQDIVEDIGEAVGLTYEDNEPLHTTEKITDRDRHRWELDPASSEDYGRRVNHEGE